MQCIVLARTLKCAFQLYNLHAQSLRPCWLHLLLVNSQELQVAEARKRGDIGERTNQGQTTVKLTTIEAEVQRENNLRHDRILVFHFCMMMTSLVSNWLCKQTWVRPLTAGSPNIGTLPLFMRNQESLLLN